MLQERLRLTGQSAGLLIDGDCEVVFGLADMGHRMHVLLAVTQRAAAE